MPGSNPIEMLFSKRKHGLRRTAARTTDAVLNAIGPILDTVSAEECENYFVKAGYNRT